MAKECSKIKSYLKIAFCMFLMLPALLWAKPVNKPNKPYETEGASHMSSGQYSRQSRAPDDRPVQYYAHYGEEGHRHRTLDELNAEERKKVIKRRKDFESLSKEKKEKIRKAKKRYQKLPAQKRQALKNKWDKMTAEEKKAYLKKLKKKRK